MLPVFPHEQHFLRGDLGFTPVWLVMVVLLQTYALLDGIEVFGISSPIPAGYPF